MSNSSVFTSPGAADSVVTSARPSPGDDVAELQAAGADLGQILLQPFGQRRIEIGDVAGGIDREEAGRRVVEIVDGVLQFLEDVFLPLELAGDVGDRPHRELGFALALAERPHAHAQPAPGLAAHRIDAHLLLQAAAFARRLEQAEHRFRDAGIADEHPLDRPHVVGAGGLDQPQIGGVGVDDAPGGVGHQDRVARAVDQALDQRTGRVAAGHSAACRPRARTGQTRRTSPGRPARREYRARHGGGRSSSAPRRRRPAPPRSAATRPMLPPLCPVRVRSTDARPMSPRACCCAMMVAVYPIPRPLRRTILAPFAGAG